MRMPQRIHRSIVILAVSVSLVSVACSRGGEFSNGTEISIVPQSGAVSSGQTFDRTVELKNIEGSFYAAFDVGYDPNVIEYVGATEGTFFNQKGSDPTLFLVSTKDENPGRLVVGVSRVGEIGNVSGSGRLLTLSFKAVGTGNTGLSFSAPMGIRNDLDEDVAIQSWMQGTVTVQ